MNISAAIGKSRGISKPRAYNVGASIEHCTRNTELFHQQVLWTFSCIARRSRASKLDWFCSAIKERRQQKAYARKLKVWLEKRKEGRKEGREEGRKGGREGGVKNIKLISNYQDHVLSVMLALSIPLC